MTIAEYRRKRARPRPKRWFRFTAPDWASLLGRATDIRARDGARLEREPNELRTLLVVREVVDGEALEERAQVGLHRCNGEM